MNTAGIITIEWENGTKSKFQCDRITLNARVDHNFIYNQDNTSAHMEMGVKWIQINASDRSSVGEIFYSEGSKLKSNREEKQKTSAMFCEHANESPCNCPCDSNCYCKDHSCKNKKA